MKIQEYELRKLGQNVVDFHDDLRDLINSGKFAHPIVSAVPSWTADNGEMAFYSTLFPVTDRRIYVRMDSAWVVFAQTTLTVNVVGEGSGTLSRFLLLGSAQSFETSGTWTYPSATGTSSAWVRLFGGGGGGGGGVSANGGNPTGAGGGGGGGQYTETFVAVSGNISVTVGNGGAGGAVDANGSAGTDSSFGTLAVADGGGGGAGGSGANGGAGGAGGNVGTGDIQVDGRTGETGGAVNGDGGEGGACGLAGPGGRGGAKGGSGAAGLSRTGTFVGGAGGGGGGHGGSGTASSGGAGANGIVLVYW